MYIPEYLEVRQEMYNLHLDDVPAACHLRDEDDNEFHYDGVYEMFGVRRPLCTKFLNACFRRFEKVIIWTAGTAEYAKLVCKALFKDTVRYPDLIWSLEDCQRLNDRSRQVEKPLQKLANHLQVDVRRFLLVDDNPVSGQSSPHLMLLIKPFSPHTELQEVHLLPEDNRTYQQALEKPHHEALLRVPVDSMHQQMGQWLLESRQDNILQCIIDVMEDTKLVGATTEQLIEAADRLGAVYHEPTTLMRAGRGVLRRRVM
jgi:hypothetical protein